MKKLILACISLATLCLVGCSAEVETVELFEYFDTYIEVSFTPGPDTKVEELKDDIKTLIKTSHELLNSHTGYTLKPFVELNNVFKINGFSPQTLLAHASISDCIEIGRTAYDITGGRVNVAAGSVLELWSKYRTEGIKIPPMEELLVAGEHIDYEDVINYGGYVGLRDTEMRLDFGAIAKGYITDELIKLLKRGGVVSGLVNTGGNIGVYSMNGRQRDYTVGIQNPSGDGIIDRAKIKTGSLVTSGDYQRFYMVDGVKYHHIIDMETLMPANYFTAVTVYHPESSAMADILSTALFVMSREEGEALAKSQGAQAYWVYKDKTVEYTQGFPIIN